MSDAPKVRTDESLELARTLWNGEVSSAFARVLKWVFTLGFVGVISASTLGVWRYTDQFYRDALLPPTEVEDPPFLDGSVIAVNGDQISLQVASSASPSILLDGIFARPCGGGP